ncbi:MAG: hypothetical protein ACR2PX_16755 [Endozoicomonas sp.]|uniref:hypothetical protein n=1 Tax=Endozoicomonas sp. TaxID=1892382 RepID=UPI003D9AD808
MLDHASATPRSILRKPSPLQDHPEAEAAIKPNKSAQSQKEPLAHRSVKSHQCQYLKSFGTRMAIEYFRQQSRQFQASVIEVTKPAELARFINDMAEDIFHNNSELKHFIHQFPNKCPVDLHELQTTLINDLLVARYQSFLQSDSNSQSLQSLMTLMHRAIALSLTRPDYPIDVQTLTDNPDLLKTHIEKNFYRTVRQCRNIQHYIPPEQILDHIQWHDVQAQLKASQSRLTYTKEYIDEIDVRPRHRTDLEREAGLPEKEMSKENIDSSEDERVCCDMIIGDHQTVFKSKMDNMTSAAELMTLSFWGDQMAIEDSLLDQCDLKLAQLLTVNLTNILVLAPNMAELVKKCRAVLALKEPARSTNMKVFGQHIQGLLTAELEKMDKTVTRMTFFMNWQGRNHGDVERCTLYLRRFYNENPVKYLPPMLEKVGHEYLVHQMATALDSTSEDQTLKSSLEEATERAKSLDKGKNISDPGFPKAEKQLWLRRVNEAWASGQSINWNQPAP